MAQMLVLRSSANSSLLADLRAAFPASHWIDIPMPFLPGRGESEPERRQLLQTLQSLIKPYKHWDAVFYARAYGAFSQAGREALQKSVDAPIVTAPGAVMQYVAAHQWHTLFVLTPYGQVRHDFEVRWVQEQGLTVVASACLGYDEGEAIAGLALDDLRPGILTGSRAPADGIYLACTITRSMLLGEAMRVNLPKPLISATEAMLWELRERLGRASL